MRIILRTICFLGLGAAHLLPAVSGFSQDWPQWRGPSRDGVVHGVSVPKRWPKILTEQWKVTVGEGVSSPVVVGTSVFVFTRQKDNEVVLCLDVATGKENWRSVPYQAPYKAWFGEPASSKPGPRSTPTVSEGRVYTTGVSGVLSCLDAKTGKLLWRKQSKSAPPYGGAASPLLVDGLCIVHVGCGKTDEGLTGFDAATGEVKWYFANGTDPGHGSPLLVELAGERQVVGIASGSLRSFSVETGKKMLWQVPLNGSESTPVLYKDLIIFAGSKDRPRAIRLEKGASGITPKEVWKGDGPTLYMSTPVLAGDALFGMSVRRRGCFFCLDARNGKTRWETDEKQGFGYASVLNAGSVLLFLTSGARLVVVKPNVKEYEQVAEYQVSDRQTWAHPVFLGDRVLIRDEWTLRSLRIEPAGK